MFDWSDYENLARSLKGGNEAAKRSAISRLYYSVYHRALLQLEQTTDFVHSPNKPAHQQVWDRYVKEGRTFRSVGNKGRRLREFRDTADYSANIPNLDQLLEESFDLADSILYWLDKIQPTQ